MRQDNITESLAEIRETLRSGPGKQQRSRLALEKLDLEEERARLNDSRRGFQKDLHDTLRGHHQGELFEGSTVVRCAVISKPITDKLMAEMDEDDAARRQDEENPDKPGRSREEVDEDQMSFA